MSGIRVRKQKHLGFFETLVDLPNPEVWVNGYGAQFVVKDAGGNGVRYAHYIEVDAETIKKAYKKLAEQGVYDGIC